MTRLRLRLAACAGLACVAALGLTNRLGSGQESMRGPGRVIVQATGLPGIDRGLRDHDGPQEPRGRAGDLVRQMARADGQPASRGSLRGSLIVKFRPSATLASVTAAIRQVEGSSLEQPSHADFAIVAIPADRDPEETAAALRTLGEVEYAQPRYFNHPMLRPNDPLYDRQWNFPAIDMERVWDIQPAAGDQVTVAVLDTGVAFQTAAVQYTSRFPFRLVPGGPLFAALGAVEVPFAVAPELGGAKFVSPRDFIWGDTSPFDLDGHGTHVSGTIGQLTNNGVGVAGMAYNVRIMPVKVIDETWDFIFDSPFFGTDDIVARGIRYAADSGAQVINMSIGRTGGGPATAVEDAIRYAVSRGVFVAVAAGNSGDGSNAPSRIAEIAPTIAGMVSVAAVGRSLERAYYSTTNAYVEIAAPGGDQRRDGGTGGVLQQTIDQDLLNTYTFGPQRITPPRADAFAYYYFQGTSMATPHVSAFAAMLIQQGVKKPAAIEAAMKQFARDIGRPGVDSEFGAGLIQPRTTLRGLGLAR